MHAGLILNVVREAKTIPSLTMMVEAALKSKGREDLNDMCLREAAFECIEDDRELSDFLSIVSDRMDVLSANEDKRAGLNDAIVAAQERKQKVLSDPCFEGSD